MTNTTLEHRLEDMAMKRRLELQENAHTKKTQPDLSALRKATPLHGGCLKYFPDALLAVAYLSKIGNDKHNPGEPLHWSRGKSNDHKECIARHSLEAGTVDHETGLLHDIPLAWRALANLQIELEKHGGFWEYIRNIKGGASND